MSVLDEVFEDQQKKFEKYEQKISHLKRNLAEKERSLAEKEHYCYSSDQERVRLNQAVDELCEDQEHLKAQLEEMKEKLKHSQSVHESEMEKVQSLFSSMASELEADVTWRIVQLEEKLKHAESASRIVKGELLSSLSLHDRRQHHSLDQDESRISIAKMTSPYFKKSSAELFSPSDSPHFSTENCTEFDLSADNDSESDTELTPEH